MNSKAANKFIQAAKYLDGIPSWIFAIAYILVIFIFAVLYTFLPNDFYHSTAQYENSLNSDAEDILEAIQKHIFENQKKVDSNGNISINDKVFIDRDNFLVHSLKFEDSQNNEVSFKIRLIIYDNNKYGLSQIGGSYEFKFTLENKIGTFDEKNKEMIYYFTLTPEDMKNLETFNGTLDYKQQDIYKTLFPEKYINGSSAPNMLIMTMSQKLLNRIIGLKNASKGFPSSVSNSFGRMFYLSAITITTVGYGDIVPITNIARTLISIEAIFGVVIIGMFLNSLSLSFSESISKSEKEKVERQKKISEIEKLLRYDKVMQMHSNEYLLYAQIITTPIDNRFKSEWSKDFKFTDMYDLFKTSLLIKDNNFEPAINGYYRHQKDFINVLQELVFNIELSYWSDLEQLSVEILKISNDFDYSNYILNQPNTRVGDQTGAEFDSKMIKEHVGEVKFLQSNTKNSYVALYYQIKSYIEFIDNYNQIINEIKANLVQLKKT